MHAESKLIHTWSFQKYEGKKNMGKSQSKTNQLLGIFFQYNKHVANNNL